jgi:voltage-gated potassium channel
MLAGIALLGIVTASLASWLIDKVRDVEEHAQAATPADVAALTAEVRALRDELAEREPVVSAEALFT